MGIFDLVGKVVEKTTETIVSAPMLPIKVVGGIEKGAKKGIREIEEALEEMFERL